MLKGERQSLILKYAVEHLSLHSEVMAHDLQVSTKTVINDMEEMNSMFRGAAKFQGGHGVFQLCIYDYERFKNVSNTICYSGNYDSSLQRAIAIVNILWHSERPLYIEDLAEQMNVSRSTLNVDLRHARELLKPYYIKIIGKPNVGLSIQGNEFLIRLFIAENISEAVYPLVLTQDLSKGLQSLTDKIGFDKVNKKRFYRFLCILVDRVTEGHWITVLPEPYVQIPHTVAFELLMPPIIASVEDFLKISLPEKEQVFLSLPIVSMQTPTDVKFISNLPVRQDINILLRQISSQIQKELNLSVTWQDFQPDFMYHLEFLINRLNYNCQVKNPFANEIRRSCPFAFLMAEITGQVIEQYYNNRFSVTTDELSYIAAYFNTFFLENKMRLNEQCKAVLVCGSGRAIARLAIAQLRKMLHIHSNVDLLPDFEVDKAKLSQYDMIFTTEDVKSLSALTDKPVIPINPISSGYDVMTDIECAQWAEQMSSPKRKSNSLLVSILQPDCFFYLNDGKSYSENVKRMVDTLLSQGLLDEGFPMRLKQREMQETMIYENGVAFLHTINKAVDKPVLAVGVLHHPLVSSKRKVKVIFLLGIQEHAETSDSLIIRIYEEIIKISRSSQTIEKLSQVKDYDECLGVIQEVQKFFTL